MGCGASQPEAPAPAAATPAAAKPPPSSKAAAPSAEASNPKASDVPQGKKNASKPGKAAKKPAAAGGGGKRRLAVTTDYAEEDDTVEEFLAKVVPKSDADQEKIATALETNFVFKGLEKKLAATIIGAMESEDTKAGTVIMKQGDQGDYFYVVNSGKYEVTVGGKAVAVLEYPAVFGELALMYGAPRAATIKAVEDGTLWKLDRNTFRGTILSSPTSRLLRFLRSVPVLQGISEHSLVQLSEVLEASSFKEGQVISNFPDRFYILREGMVSVKKNKNGVPIGEETNRLQAKSFFGDREILTGQGGDTYTAAKGGCKLLSLSKEVFVANLSSLEQPLTDNLKFNVLRCVPLLSDLSEEQLSEVVDSFKTENVEKGSYIIKQGSMGSKFFILQKGRVKVIVNGEEVVEQGAYSFFGERSLLNDDLTAADIVAATEDVSVLSLDRESFDVLLGPLKDIIAKQNKIRMLKTVPLLKPLSEVELDALADCLVSVIYEDGERIIKQATAGHTFFMIKNGIVTVTKDSAPDQELVRLQKGSFFGERALLDDEPRAANITAVGQVECLTIDRSDFDKHLGSLKDIMNVHSKKLARQKIERSIKYEDLEEVAVLGSGAFGLVSLVKDQASNNTYALKAINKKYVQKTKTQAQLRREVLVLGEIDNPFLMKLVKTFKDSRRVYFLTEPLLGGELFSHLADANCFSEERSRFCAGCVLIGLNHLHTRGVIYRDLKLENLLLDKRGYVKIVDFGFAKKLKKNEWTYTLCGTPDYLAPEVLKGTGHNKGADYWSLGVLIYEMILGYTPFGADDDSEICRNILSGVIDFEDGKISKEAKDLVRRLLNRDLRARLGCGKTGVKAIMQHPWFAKTDWLALEKHQVTPPFIPDIEDDFDVSNFDEVDDSCMHQEDSEPCEDKMLDAVFGSAF